MISRGGAMIAQVKILWSGLAKELATWEDEAALKMRFPAAPAWGQAGSQGRGNVSTPAVAPPEKRTNGKRLRRASVKLSGPEWAGNPQ